MKTILCLFLVFLSFTQAPRAKSESDSDTDLDSDSDNRSMIFAVIKTGRSRITGDLSKPKSIATSGFQVVTRPNEAVRKYLNEHSKYRKLVGGFESRLQIDFDNLRTRQQGEFFLVPPEENVKIEMFDLVGQFCFLTEFPVQVCPYFGIGQVMERDAQKEGKRYSSTDSTFPYGLVISADFPVYKTYRLALGGQLGAYSVEQIVNEKKVGFRVVSTLFYAGVGF